MNAQEMLKMQDAQKRLNVIAENMGALMVELEDMRDDKSIPDHIRMHAAYLHAQVSNARISIILNDPEINTPTEKEGK